MWAAFRAVWLLSSMSGCPKGQGKVLLGLLLFITGSAEALQVADAPHAPKQIDLAHKIGQMLQVRVYGDFASFREPEYLAALQAIRRDHVGSLDLRVHIDGPNLLRPKPEMVARILNSLQQASDVPLLIGADLERGLITRVSDTPDMPNVMAWASTGDPHLARKAGELAAEESRAIGIQWTFAPVVDVNSDPYNPIIGDRAFSDNPEEVGLMADEFIRGARSKGLLTTAKHFPGHGDTSSDSHVGIVTFSQDMTHLRLVELPPFRKAIEADVDAVMLAHARVPALEPDPAKITTTSKKVIEDFLRKDMHFHGVVVTDSMEMRGVTDLYKGKANPTAEAVVDAVKAGADIIMLPEHVDEAYDALMHAVSAGEIPESRIDESVRRIFAMKERVGLIEHRLVNIEALKSIFPDTAGEQLAQTIADRSVTLVRDKSFTLPLRSATGPNATRTKSNQEKFVLVLLTDSRRSPLGKALEEEFLKRQPETQVRHVYYDNRSTWELSDLLETVRGGDSVVLATFMTNLGGKKDVGHGKIADAVGLNNTSAELFEKMLRMAGPKGMVVALGSPYLILKYPEIPNYVCTFSISSTSERSAVKALFGEIRNDAKLPITLPGIAKRTFSIPWPQRVATSK